MSVHLCVSGSQWVYVCVSECIFCVCRYVHLCVCMGFDGHVTVFMSMFLCTCANGCICIYLCCGGVCYVCDNAWVFIHVSEYTYVHEYVFHCVSLFELFHVSTLKSVGSASPIHTYRAPSSAQQEKAHCPQQQSLNCPE